MTMNSDKDVVGYLLLNKVHIVGANSISSPLTYGFPAVTGFLGAFHALSRKVMAEQALAGYALGGVLLACHDCQPQIYRPSKYSDYTFNQTRNPLKKDGSTASIIEEGRCHLTMSFVVELLGDYPPTEAEQTVLMQQCQHGIYQQRIAGGSVHGMAANEPIRFIAAHDIDLLAPLLMPAFVLMDANAEFSDIIDTLRSKRPETTALEALIEVGTLHHIPEPVFKDGENTGQVRWTTTSVKSGRAIGGGWLVPMPIGYQGIAECYGAGQMQHARHSDYPSQYVEVIYGLGKWVYPQRLSDDFHTAFWHYALDTEQSLYLVQQSQSPIVFP